MNKKEKEAGVLSLSHKGNKSDSIEELYVSRENKKNDKFSKLPLKINTARFVKGIKGTDEFLENDILQIAFFGRSNAGKSSTINALLGRNTLVKSSSTPGKTKEINLFEVNDTFHIVDLPGYGYAKISQTERESLRKLIE
jgi:GTP-binding protein EngB required for normal cell division